MRIKLSIGLMFVCLCLLTCTKKVVTEEEGAAPEAEAQPPQGAGLPSSIDQTILPSGDSAGGVIGGAAGLSMSKAQLAQAYGEASDNMMSITDHIKRDWANGLLSDTDYLKQKLCYIYNDPCLLEKYRPQNIVHREDFCGTDFFPALMKEIQSLGVSEEEIMTFLKRMGVILIWTFS